MTETLSGAEPGEGPKARADRELNELVGEIRVALPGVELLFGFLLIVPFSARIGELGTPQRLAYLTSLIATAAASALFMALTARHRLGFREIDKEELVRRVGHQVLIGLLLVAIAISTAVGLVVSVVLGDTAWAWILGGGVAAWYALCWYVGPRLRDHRARTRQRAGR